MHARIAAEGILLTTMRANCTVCSPSRAAPLTGRYADRVAVPGVIRTQSEDSWGYFDPKVPTLAERLALRAITPPSSANGISVSNRRTLRKRPSALDLQ